jgi:hypothetical protein
VIPGWNSLNALAARYVPDRYAVIEGAYQAREKQAVERWPNVKMGQDMFASDEAWREGWLAKARRDVELTYAVFREYELNGERRLH